ncbi:MAG: hypothetical protein M3022_06795 [Actinomycetota bacterium]|nr:hypothetical protein [Actinomycetota bacterium]
MSDPHLLADGDYLITFTHDAECGSSGGQCLPIANTCASRIETINPATGGAKLRFTESGAWRVFDAVPSPRDRYVALIEQACDGSTGRLVVHDLWTGRQHVAARNLSDCALSSSATWTTNGAKLVFAFTQRSDPNDPGANCSLATAPAGRTTASSSWPLIRPDASCGFQSSAFDNTGLVAAETCAPTKDSKLIQYSSRSRVVRRLSLAPWDYGVTTQVAADPLAHTVLVSQITYTQPDVTTVWTFNGTKLHVVNVYFGSAIIAQP